MRACTPSPPCPLHPSPRPATRSPHSEALRARLEEDRRARRRKLGLPEELTEEERAAEAERERAKAEEAAASKRHVYVKPISGGCGLNMGGMMYIYYIYNYIYN